MISEECNDWAGVYKVQTFGTTQLQGGMGSAIKDGGKPSGNWSVVNNNGKNTVHAVDIGNTSLKYMGNTVYFANWKVGRSMYVGMMSFFDKNATKQIVKTLAVS